ncbi:hypothetical protein OH146_03415 [Salinibacterium sp. SYSU T00001]|uniref:hypothetical protein n=1 Tax=Homoserinimonas sedimenticola TaxID=2986805 RepID=UPI002236A6DC|nr:hypothetical protein [Salinibacterium sedimenticola]MCW4384819.1 hypothetical protein [Salinibacterium sedimenticola]
MLGAPTSAVAASDVVLVSADGTAYGTELSGSVFTDIANMVPGDSQTGSFYVRNAGENPGFLRIVLKDVSVSDDDLADALTIAADTASQEGEATPVALAEPCWVLSEGEVVPPDTTARIDLTAAIGNLDGTRGQGAIAEASLGVSLSDTTPGSLSPSDCGGPDVSVSLTPVQPPGATVGAVVEQGPSQSGGLVPNEPDLPVLSVPEILGIDPNTWHLLEEYWVLLPVGAFFLGNLVYFLIVRRRRPEDETEQLV